MNNGELVVQLKHLFEEQYLGEGPVLEPKEVVVDMAMVEKVMTDFPELASIDKDMLLKGMQVEMEHSDVVDGDIVKVARIAADHIKEFPGKDYYDALSKMEHELSETPEEEKVEQSDEVKPEMGAGEELSKEEVVDIKADKEVPIESKK